MKRIIKIIILISIILAIPYKNKIDQAYFSTVIYSADNELLGAKVAKDGQWRFPKNESVSNKFIKCITTFEDKRFYYHFGIDVFALIRAVSQNIKHKKTISGGSTITMQMVRILYKNKKRNIWNKLIEMLLSLRFELTHKKNEILELYANNAPFGGNVIGLETASWRYFHRNSHSLSWAENALLAVLPNNPSYLHLSKNRQKLQEKRDKLLDKLYQEKIIDKETWQLSLSEPLPEKPLPMPNDAPHIFHYIDSNINQPIQTFIDKNLQETINTIATKHALIQSQNGVQNIAVIVAEIQSGKIIAYVGNAYNNALQAEETQYYVDCAYALRSSGSILKPFFYANLLENGNILPNSLLADIPTSINGYNPQNYNLKYRGAISASDALTHSLNIPFVRILQKYSVPKLYNDFKRMGITTINRSPDNYGLSLILGGAEVRLIELCGVYASMARSLNYYNLNNNFYNMFDYHPLYIQKKDSILSQKIQQTKISPILDIACVYNTFEAMKTLQRPDEDGNWQNFSSSQNISWKTGTSFGNRDAWSIGVTPKYVVGVWVGNADGEGRSELTGVKSAAPIMFDVFNLLPRAQWFAKPFAALKKINVCKQSGYRTSIFCNESDTIFVPKTALQAEQCTYHHLLHLNLKRQYQVNVNCISMDSIVNVSYFILPPTMEYYYIKNHPEYNIIPPFAPNCGGEIKTQNMEVIYPDKETKIYVPNDFEKKLSNVIFQVAHRNYNSTIFWNIDGQYIGKTIHEHQLPLQPSVGKHKLELVDNTGERLIQWFEIIAKE